MSEIPGQHPGETPEEAMSRIFGSWNEVVTTSAKISRRNRQLIKVLGVILALQIALTIVIAIGYSKLNTNSVTVSSVQRADHTSCVVSNKDRTIILNLWKAALSDRQGSKPQTQQLIHQAEEAYAQREC